jgi:hypothetical protein
MRDSGDVCRARNTQFEQEFLGLFRGETVSAYDWRDRIGDFCVADYLAELDMVHVMRYSTPFSLHLGRTSSRPPTSASRAEKMLSASATDRALASFMTSDVSAIFVASYPRGSYRNVNDTKSGKRREMTARLSFNTACELGFRGSLNEWERLMGAVARR